MLMFWKKKNMNQNLNKIQTYVTFFKTQSVLNSKTTQHSLNSKKNRQETVWQQAINGINIER